MCILAVAPCCIGQPASPALAPQAAAAEPVSPAQRVQTERLVATIKSLPTKRAARGDADHQAGLRETERIIADQLRALGYEPRLEEVAAIGLGREKTEPFHNIIVDIKGTGTPRDVAAAPGDPPVAPGGRPDQHPPSTPHERRAPSSQPGLLIVGAHIDAVPRAPGADDDGTGVAALMEMARIFKDYPMKHDVRLCFFNLEECGLVGSTIHAQRVRDDIVTPNKQPVIGMIAMDMLGFYSDAPESQKSPIPPIGDWSPPDVADFIAMATVLRHRTFSQALTKAMKEASPGLKVVTVDFLPVALPDLLRSDHAPFLAIGVPAVIVSDTAEFRSKHYHKPSDTLDTLDLPRFTATVRGLVGAVHHLAEPAGPDRPASEPASAR